MSLPSRPERLLQKLLGAEVPVPQVQASVTSHPYLQGRPRTWPALRRQNRAMLSKLNVYSNHLTYLKFHTESGGLAWGLRGYTSDKLPSNANGAGPWTTL